MDYEKRALWASQRERVFRLRNEIYRMLDDGVAIRAMKDRVGLEDMPYATFYRNIAKLRDAPRAVATGAATVDLQTPTPSPAAASVQSAATETAQPKEEKPKRKPAPKKRKFVDATAEYYKENPKKVYKPYNPADARNIK